MPAARAPCTSKSTAAPTTTGLRRANARRIRNPTGIAIPGKNCGLPEISDSSDGFGALLPLGSELKCEVKHEHEASAGPGVDCGRLLRRSLWLYELQRWRDGLQRRYERKAGDERRNGHEHGWRKLRGRDR